VLHQAGSRHEDVGRLDVAVDHAAGVSEGEGSQHLARAVDGIGEREPAATELVLQADAVDELRDHQDPVFDLERGPQRDLPRGRGG
jgi:hypothetical protein